MLRRAFAWNLGAVPVSEAECEVLSARGVQAEPLRRYLVWRRSALLLVVFLTAVVALLGTVNQLTGIAQLGEANTQLQQSNPAAKLSLSGLGMFYVALTIIALFAMPLTALFAMLQWSQLRPSRAIILWGWGVSFLIPLLLGLLPVRWLFTIEGLSPGEEMAFFQVFGLLAALSSFFMLMPVVLSLVSGVVAGCLRIKTLLPASVVPGWFLVSAAYLHALILFVVFLTVNYIASSGFLVVATLLLAFGPLVYVVQGATFVRPLLEDEGGSRVGRARLLNLAAVVPAGVLFTVYLLSAEFFDKRLLSFNPDGGLMTPWKLLELYIGYLGRSLFMTVLAIDVLMRMNQTVWFDLARFAETPEARDYGRLMDEFRQTEEKG